MTRREKLEARLQVITPTLIELACHRERIGNSIHYRKRIESQYRELLEETVEIKKLIGFGWGA